MAKSIIWDNCVMWEGLALAFKPLVWSWSSTSSTADEFSMQRAQRLQQEIALLTMCLVIASVAGGPSGISNLPTVEGSTHIMKNEQFSAQNQNFLNTQIHMARKLRQQEPSNKSMSSSSEVKRGLNHMLHEVPSGPNPISNEIPSKLIEAEKLPTQPPHRWSKESLVWCNYIFVLNIKAAYKRAQTNTCQISN